MRYAAGQSNIAAGPRNNEHFEDNFGDSLANNPNIRTEKALTIAESINLEKDTLSCQDFTITR